VLGFAPSGNLRFVYSVQVGTANGHPEGICGTGVSALPGQQNVFPTAAIYFGDDPYNGGLPSTCMSTILGTDASSAVSPTEVSAGIITQDCIE